MGSTSETTMPARYGHSRAGLQAKIGAWEGVLKPARDARRNDGPRVGMDRNECSLVTRCGRVGRAAQDVAPSEARLSPPRLPDLLFVVRAAIPWPTNSPYELALRLVPGPLVALDVGVPERRRPILEGKAPPVHAHTEVSFVLPRLMRFSTRSKRSGSASSFASRSENSAPINRSVVI